MARLVEPSKPLNKISIKGLKPFGVIDEDVDELRLLGIGNLEALMQAVEDHDGHLNELSTLVIVIEDAQSDRIGDALLQHPAVPAAFKAKFAPSNPETEPTAPGGTPATPVVGAQKPESEWTTEEKVLHVLALGFYNPKYQ
jgi:hypothetical protein